MSPVWVSRPGTCAAGSCGARSGQGACHLCPARAVLEPEKALALMRLNARAAGLRDSQAVHKERTMYKHLLVPVDGSELSERAMRASIDLARQLGAAITGFVAEPDMPLPNVGTQPTVYARQRDVHEQRSDGHAHEVLTRFGAMASEAGVEFKGRHAITDSIDTTIANLARELDCDMIVMVTHGRGAFGELLFGSHTRNVLAKSQIPLLVLH